MDWKPRSQAPYSPLDKPFSTNHTYWRRRRSTLLRIGGCLLLAAFFYFLHSPLGREIPNEIAEKLPSQLPDALPKDLPIGKSEPDEKPIKPLQAPAPPTKHSASTLERMGISPEAYRKIRSDAGITSDADEDYESSSKGQARISMDSRLQKSAETFDFDFNQEIEHVSQALKQIVKLLPDELRTEELLKPFQGTGTEKLRDVGVKARIYKSLLEAWETLHLVRSSHGVHSRDDMIAFIKANHESLDFKGGVAKTLRQYESFRGLLTKLADLLFPWTMPYFPDHMALHTSFSKAGRGIVLSAGEDQVPFLLATIPTMRELGCKLPIEIMYLGEADIDEEYRDILEQLPGVTTRDIKRMVRDEGWALAGWAAKPFAMLLSSFQEVMFIDADAVFFRDPEELFDNPQYVETGALFFTDRSIFPESKRKWLKEILPKPISESTRRTRLWTGESGHQQESGVVVVDKWRHFVELMLVTRMNGPDRDGNNDLGIVGIYDMVYGDKETFWLAWELLGNSDYAFHKGHRGAMGRSFVGPPKKEGMGGPLYPELQSQQYVAPEVEEPSSPYQTTATASSASPSATSDANIRISRQDLSDFQTSSDSSTEAPAAGTAEAESASGSPKTYDSTTSESDNTIAPSSNGEEQEATLRKRSTDGDLVGESSHLDTATNYTICAPQLLHLDSNARPLWFNGWLAMNKFKKAKESEPGIFDVWNKEPERASEKDAWWLGESNMCCLTSPTTTKFTKEEKKVLETVLGFAREVGAIGRESQ